MIPAYGMVVLPKEPSTGNVGMLAADSFLAEVAAGGDGVHKPCRNHHNSAHIPCHVVERV